VPDENATMVDEVYEGVMATEWPQADFIVGNPPFIGAKWIRQNLGAGYFEVLTKTYSELPEFTDFVMYWWNKAATYVGEGKAIRFGFITTNSITQNFNRRTVEYHLNSKKPIHLAFAISDHPWVDSKDGAAVRIAMTVGAKGHGQGIISKIVKEIKTNHREIDVETINTIGKINADLSIGTDISSAKPLMANDGISYFGMALHGEGFIVTHEEAKKLGFGRIPGIERHIRPFRNGNDITQKTRNLMVIDLFGLTATQTRENYPEIYQRIIQTVKPERDMNNRASIRDKWWIFGWPRPILRNAITNLSRIIVTTETRRQRTFTFLDSKIVPNHQLICFAVEDAYYLGLLSCRFHVLWAEATGGKLVGSPRYNSTVCFSTFPFPIVTPEQQTNIRGLGEKLDVHRKTRQALYSDLTLTSTYNVLEALRQGREFTAKEKTICEQGLVTVLRELHDELDAAVAEAYGWPTDLPDEEILSRLVALNAERIEEEKQGQIRWLRPEYQTKSKAERRVVQTSLDFAPPPEPLAKGKKGRSAKTTSETKPAWPSDILEQTQAIRSMIAALREAAVAITPDTVAERFTRAPRVRVQEILQALETLGFM
jgi:hypothetical protein